MKAQTVGMSETAKPRPTDAELAKMSDAEILAGDWLVDIEDSTFWNRWDEANINLTTEIDTAVSQGRASYYRPVPIWTPTRSTEKQIVPSEVDQELAAMYDRQLREMKAALAGKNVEVITEAEAQKRHGNGPARID